MQSSSVLQNAFTRLADLKCDQTGVSAMSTMSITYNERQLYIRQFFWLIFCNLLVSILYFFNKSYISIFLSCDIPERSRLRIQVISERERKTNFKHTFLKSAVKEIGHFMIQNKHTNQQKEQLHIDNKDMVLLLQK